jgi:hypothetical protein
VNPTDLQETISRSPGTLAVGTRSLIAQRPFLRDLVALGPDLSATAHELRASLPTIDSALVAGTPVLRTTPAFNARLSRTLEALQRLSVAPGTSVALRGLTDTVDTLNPQLRFLGPYQTVCNGWNYFWTYVAEHLSEEDSNGYAQRALLNSNGQQTNGIGSQNAVVPSNGVGYVPASAPRGAKEYLHGQPYMAAIDHQGNADCEFGQFGYMRGRLATATVDGVTASPPKDFNVVVAPHIPGDQGPTYKGRARVPKGETFQAEPNIGVISR